MPALVSVCIPAYNNADTISDTITSVLTCDYKNLEVILVDDHSDDGTYEVARAFCDERLKVFKNEKNLGMAGNWNRCLSLCTGTYVRLLCGDDRIDPDLISMEVAVLESVPSVVMVSSDTAFVNKAGEVVGHYDRYRGKRSALRPILKLVRGEPYVTEVYDESHRFLGKEIVRYSFFTRDYLGAPLANLFRREVAGAFDKDFSYIIDYDFFVDIALKGDVYVIPEKKNYFMLRDLSNTAKVLSGSDGAAYLAEHKRLVEKYGDRLGMGAFGRCLSVMIRRVTIVMGGLYLRKRESHG